jgi:hypothetical protein
MIMDKIDGMTKLPKWVIAASIVASFGLGIFQRVAIGRCLTVRHANLARA